MKLSAIQQRLVELVKQSFPAVNVFFRPADPDYPCTIPVLCFFLADKPHPLPLADVVIDCSDDLFTIVDYDQEYLDREIYIIFKDPLHVLPYIYFLLDSADGGYSL